MSGVPCVFDGKTCAHDELIMSSALRVFDGKMCTCDELICVVHHVWLMVN